MTTIVVGGGLLGLSTAYHLLQRGVRVTVVDAAPHSAAGASRANGGLLTPSMSDPWNAPGVALHLLRWLGRADAPLLLRRQALRGGSLRWMYRFLRASAPERYRVNTLKNLRLAQYSMTALRELRAETGIDYGEVRYGTAKLFRNPRAFALAERASGMLVANGVTVRVLDRAATLDLEPALEPIARDIAGALHFPDDEIGDARRFCEALATELGRRGCNLRFGVALERWKHTRDRLSGVETNEGFLEADNIVLAAGVQSAPLARSLGIDIPVAPAKGYSISVPLGHWAPQPKLGVIDDELHAAATPLGEVLRVAGTAEFAGFDASIRPERVENLRRLVEAVYPQATAVVRSTDVQAWAGLRPMSSDGVPILGRTTIENLFVNTGHGHLGWTMAAGSGRVVADLITRGASDLDASEYALARFG
jgi:D-amino-acid dehydrogenase